MIRAVIFDFDGLLVDSETLFHRVYAEILADYGHAFTRDDYSTGYAGRPVPAIARAFVADFGLPVSSEEVARRIHADEAVLRAEGVPLKPGARELLEHLKTHGYGIAVASSSLRSRAMSILEQHGLAGFFAASAFAEDISRGKPDPEIFLLAASRLDIDPSECLVLEDSTMGIEAAVKAGMRVICIPDMQAPDEEHRAMATAVADGLNDVIGFLFGPEGADRA